MTDLAKQKISKAYLIQKLLMISHKFIERCANGDISIVVQVKLDQKNVKESWFCQKAAKLFYTMDELVRL